MEVGPILLSDLSLRSLRAVLGRTVWSIECPGLIVDLGLPGQVRAFTCALGFGGEYLVVTARDWYESPIAYLNAHRIKVEHTDCPPWMEKLESDGSVSDWMRDQAEITAEDQLMPVNDSSVRLHWNTGDPNPAPVQKIEVCEVQRTWMDGKVVDSIQFDRVLLFKCGNGSQFSLSVDDSSIAGELIFAYAPEAVKTELENSVVRLSIS